jgi:DNA-binding CsgD family transcriptional regulator
MSANPPISAHHLADRAIRDPVYGFAEDVDGVETPAQLEAVMSRYLQAFGIGHHAFYVGADKRGRTHVRRISGKTHFAWRDHYDENQLGRTDDLLKAGLTSDEPTTWLRFRQKRKLTRRQEQIYHDAKAFGLQDGFFLPLHQRDGSMLGVTMMVPHTMPTDNGTLAILHMLSIQYAQAARRLGLVAAAGMQDDEAEPDLTAKQIECLQWVAAGKSTWEIGEILKRSEYTIDEHLAAARKRLGVRTTTQAVMQAVLRGWIRP